MRLRVPFTTIARVLSALIVVAGAFTAATLAPTPSSAQTDQPGVRPADRLQPSAIPARPVAPFITVTGAVSSSVDAVGTNDPAGALVTVEKPAGATVRHAFLLSATTGFSGYEPRDGDVSLGGVDISWDSTRTMQNGISSFNAFADVTTNVKDAIDAAAAGPVSFRVVEAETVLYDGSILAVIFDDPNVDVPATVVMAYGAQQVTGDTIRLARPASIPSDEVEVRLGVGISFGFQPTFDPSIQDNRINVNGVRLSSSAGGQDDGEGSDGALITVGGVGDDPSNPTDPFARGNQSSCPRCDDEYYDLQRFLDEELVSEIELTTQNPSADDNFYFASLEVIGATATWTPARRPLLVLPGITGSFLEDADGREIWPDEGRTARNGDDEHLDVLALDANGVDPADPDDEISVNTSRGIDGLIGQSEVCPLIFCKNVGDAYNLTFEILEDDHGYVRDVDLFPFAFDWRLSTKSNGDLLIDFIEEVLEDTGADSVNILAHSQGGLVTRNALDDVRSIGLVNRVVTFGTPMLGAPRFVGVLDYQEPCQAEPPWGLPGCFVDRAKAQELSTNWPGALELLPSRSFFVTYGSAINRDFDDDGDGVVEGQLSFSEFRDTLADRNLDLIDDATALHLSIDPWVPADPSVGLLRFVGTGNSTIVRIRQFQKEDCLFSWWRDCDLVETFEFEYDDGDGTVPTRSASLVGPGLGISGDAEICYIKGEGSGHGKLPQSELVMQISLDWVERGDDTCGSASVGGIAALSEPTESQTDPAPLVATELLVRGPVTGFIERLDTEGAEVMGVVPTAGGPIEIDSVDNGSYHTAPESVSYALSGEGRYHGMWEVIEDGQLALLLRTYDGGPESVRSVPPTPVRAGARVELTFRHPDPGPVAVRIDDDGDGVVDRELPIENEVRGDGAADTTPPTSTVLLKPKVGDASMIEVEISADDRGGSGVAVIEYALEPEGTSGVYDGPFTVAAIGTLHVRSIDAAGNVEAPYRVLNLDLGLCQSPTIVADGSAVVIGTEGDDVILGTDGRERIEGRGGNDVICGEGGDDVILGGLGDDMIDGGANNDRIFAGGGNDTIFDPSGRNLLFGQGGNDRIEGGGAGDVIVGGGGRDLLRGFAGDDLIDGGDGGDTIEGGNGDDDLRGGDGNDRIRDAAGDDHLQGEGGNDRLTDVVGVNHHDGGNGNDRCVSGVADLRESCER